jgi:Zn-dependent oligopeptidase
MIFTSPLDIIEITESDKSIPISVAFYEHLKKLSQENSDKNKIKENQKTLIDNIKHIFILEGIKKNKDPKEPLYIINSSSQSNGSEKEINNIPLAVELKNQDGVPKEESKESQISKMRLHEQNKKSPRWLKYLTGIAVLGALCIVVKYKYNSIAEAIENSFLAKIFGKKA